MNARTIAAALIAGTALVGITAVGADASARPSSADKAVMVQANTECAPITDDVRFESCVIGAFILERERYIDSHYYTYNNDGDIVLTKRSHKI